MLNCALSLGQYCLLVSLSPVLASVRYHRPQYKMTYLQFRKKNVSTFQPYPMFPRLFALVPALLIRNWRKTKVKVENKDKTLYLKHDPKCCICNRNILYLLSFWVKYILFRMKWKVSFSRVVCENTCRSWEKNKKQNAGSGLKGPKAGTALKFHQIGDKHNAWNIECIFGYHFMSYSVCLLKILKQMDHSQRRNSVSFVSPEKLGKCRYHILYCGWQYTVQWDMAHLKLLLPKYLRIFWRNKT